MAKHVFRVKLSDQLSFRSFNQIRSRQPSGGLIPAAGVRSRKVWPSKGPSPIGTMGNFLAILAPEAFREEARLLFRSGLGIAREILLQVPNQTVEIDWSSVALFPRQNGSGGSIVSDPETGSWLLALGTWFHEDDFSDGHEGRLLQRYLRVGAAQLGLELEGFFTVAVGDGRTQEVVVITDVVGSCHCFVRLLHPAVALSGSSLLLAGLQAFALDPIGCQEFLRTGVIYQDRTLYKGVRKLGPARVFCF